MRLLRTIIPAPAAPAAAAAGGQGRSRFRRGAGKDGPRADPGARHHRRAHPRRLPQGQAPPVRRPLLPRPGLRRLPPAHRRRPDHLPALHRGHHDLGHRPGFQEKSPGDRHRLRLPGRRPGRAGARGLHHRDLPVPGPHLQRSSCAARATATSTSAPATATWAGPRPRPSTASSSPAPRTTSRRR